MGTCIVDLFARITSRQIYLGVGVLDLTFCGPAPSSFRNVVDVANYLNESVCKPACCVYLHCIAFGFFSPPRHVSYSEV